MTKCRSKCARQGAKNKKLDGESEDGKTRLGFYCCPRGLRIMEDEGARRGGAGEEGAYSSFGDTFTARYRYVLIDSPLFGLSKKRDVLRCS